MNQATLQPLKVLAEAWVSSKAYCYERYPDSLRPTVNTELTSCFTNIHLFYEKRMHFQNLQDRHKLCIFDITLFAYDFLFEQHRNSHDECLNEQKHFQLRGRRDYCPSSGAIKSRFGESLKGQNSLGQISA